MLFCYFPKLFFSFLSVVALLTIQIANRKTKHTLNSMVMFNGVHLRSLASVMGGIFSHYFFFWNEKKNVIKTIKKLNSHLWTYFIINRNFLENIQNLIICLNFFFIRFVWFLLLTSYRNQFWKESKLMNNSW